MTTRELRHLLPDLQDIQPDVQWNDAALIAYARIFTSLHKMVFLTGLEDEFGNRKLYRAKLETLYHLLGQRYTVRTSLIEKASLLEAMLSVNEANSAADEHLADNLISSYLDSFGEDTYNPDEFFAVMKLLLTCMYGIIEEEDEDPHLWITFIREKFAVWSEELNKNGYWPGITGIEALQRLILLAMNSNILVDDSYDREIQRGYDYYCAGRELPDALSDTLPLETLRFHALQYEFLCQGSFNLSEHIGRLDEIAGLMEAQIPRLPATSEEAFYYRSIVIENCCRHVSRE